ncbi:MAG: hypothetical protein E6G25_03175 [Actinobacteria bacterium]|nr:MAG: hypothetical protein E6G25_03175 [Actinomycetota bacterium]
MSDRFEKRLERGPPVVTDGGMGVLVSSAVAGLRCPEEANIRAPESVVTLHTSFIAAGAELIETNTFGANRHKLRSQFLDNEVAAINEAGVKLAREAREISGRDVFVAGSIGPLGELGGLAADERGPVFAEQAALLEGRGVDLFMVETFFDLDELTTAIEAVQGVSGLPIVAMLTFDEDAETFGGVSARDAVERLTQYELAAVAGVLRRVRGAGPRPRRAGDRRLLRNDPDRDRSDRASRRGGAPADRPLRRRRARARRCRPRAARGNGARPPAPRGRVGYVRRARSAEGRQLRVDAGRHQDAERLGCGRFRRHQ